MKATGIVRRIDELGRVVIPKEIRRTLRIREGDPLEIFTDKDGEVILKKYSLVGELRGLASEYAESLAQALGHTVCICDNDMVVAVSGGTKKDFADKSIHRELESVISNRKPLICHAGQTKMYAIVSDDNAEAYTAQVLAPILSDGQPIGVIAVLSRQEGAKMSDIELKVAQSAAGVVGKQMEG